ncbi:MAG: ATP-grasp domain-containing protein, partial [Candidatus Aenigmatarchaeota archaeon]
IAPSGNGELERITQKLEKNDIRVLGAEKPSIRIARNKWKTYEHLREDVSIPKTWRDQPNEDEEIIVSKPEEGAGCENTKISNSSSTKGEKDI